MAYLKVDYVKPEYVIQGDTVYAYATAKVEIEFCPPGGMLVWMRAYYNGEKIGEVHDWYFPPFAQTLWWPKILLCSSKTNPNPQYPYLIEIGWSYLTYEHVSYQTYLVISFHSPQARAFEVYRAEWLNEGGGRGLIIAYIKTTCPPTSPSDTPVIYAYSTETGWKALGRASNQGWYKCGNLFCYIFRAWITKNQLPNGKYLIYAEWGGRSGGGVYIDIDWKKPGSSSSPPNLGKIIGAIAAISIIGGLAYIGLKVATPIWEEMKHASP